MLKFRKMAAAAVVICMMLTLVPVLAVGDLSVGVAYAASDTTASGSTSSDTTASNTTPPSTTPGVDNPAPAVPSLTDVNNLLDAVKNASTAAEIATALSNSPLNSYDQAAALGSSDTAAKIIEAANEMDSTVIGDKGADKVTTSVPTPADNPDITFGIGDVIGLATAAVLEDTSADATYSGTLKISEPSESLIDLYGFDPEKSAEVDIDLLVDGNPFTNQLKAPIYITLTLPAHITLENLHILNYHDGSGDSDEVPFRSLGGKKIQIGLHQFSVIVFSNYATGSSSGSSKDTPTPIVPVLYDITKAGDTFSYKVLIANGGGNMSGATVTVSLNDRYKSTVTIGSDGIGQGTLEASGFAAGVAVFYARINGISNPGVTKPMIVSSSGRVLPR